MNNPLVTIEDIVGSWFDEWRYRRDDRQRQKKVDQFRQQYMELRKQYSQYEIWQRMQEKGDPETCDAMIDCIIDEKINKAEEKAQ